MIDIKFKKVYDEFIKEYEKINVNPWHEISKDELEDIYNVLVNKMDISNQITFNYFMRYIIKRLSGEEDAHTNYFKGPYSIPVNFKIFENEVLVNYPNNLRGSNLISINNIPIKNIINEIEEVITYGTLGKRKYEIEKCLFDKCVLFGLPSFRNAEKLDYLFETVDGKKISKTFILKEKYQDLFDIFEYLYGEIASYKFIDNCLLYKSTSLQSRYKDKIIEVCNNLNKEDLSNIDTIIVDIRGNTGGNSALTKPLIDFLKKHKDKKLICLTDYRVFSAGRYFLVDLINLGAITIGEEISTPINCYGESHHIVIDDNYNFSISEKYFNPLINLEIATKEEYEEKMNKEMLVPVIYKPDILVEENKKDYINGKDTILEYALKYSKDKNYGKRK